MAPPRKIDLIQPQIVPPVELPKPQPQAPQTTAAGKTFKDILLQKQAAAPVKFSAHAQMRIQNREINLSPVEIQRLTQAIDKAAEKGARESLVVMDNMALIVSIKNRTVITAINEGNMKGNVFTNIDSAVII
jgi:flagellar operon protein